MTKECFKKQNAVRWGIRWKFTIVMTLLLVSVVSILTYIQILNQKEMMEEELDKRIVLMKDNLKERGKGYVSNLTGQVEKDIAAFNFSGVIEALNHSVRKDKEILYAVLISSSGQIFSHTQLPERVRQTVHDEKNIRAVNCKELTVSEFKEKNESLIDIVNPVQISIEYWGVLRVVYTQKYLKEEMENSAEQILNKIHLMITKSLMTSMAFTFVCFLVVFLFTTKFTTPIILLTNSARRLSEGDFNTSSDIKVSSNDEVGLLASTFEDMSRKLRHSYRKLEEYSKSLEEKVSERTQELKQKNDTLLQVNDTLETTLKKLQESQAQLVQSEKMAALGQLIAGIAHEINNPLGVIRGAGGNIAAGMNKTVFNFIELLQVIPDSQRRGLMSLLEQAARNTQNLSTREARSIRRSLTARLKEEQIDPALSVADTLVDIGVYDDISPYMPLLKSSEVSKIFRTVYIFYGLNQNSRNIIKAVDRASKIVFALKKFTHRDPKGEKILTDVKDSVETVLTLYHNQIRQGVKVIRNYQKIPMLLCYQDELNQVWINLIHNALQSMEYSGTLTIDLSAENGHVSVSFTDTGPGIPLEIRDRIFEPFFTTKRAGEGSGLGLDIVKKIIDKHEGTIQFESEPGRTIFLTKFPLSDQ